MIVTQDSRVLSSDALRLALLPHAAEVGGGGSVCVANGADQQIECGIERDLRLVGGTDQTGERFDHLLEIGVRISDRLSCRVHVLSPSCVR